MAGRKANYQWDSAPAVANTVFATTASASASFQSLLTATDPVTIRRIIVDVFIALSTVGDGLVLSGRIGIILANPREIAIGATAVPLPITNGDLNWMWNRGYGLAAQLAGTDGYDTRVLHLHDDVRGMRKMKETQSLICVIENAAGGTLLSMASVRVLTST